MCSTIVLINQYEVNNYDDSDGVALCYDRTNNTLLRIVTWTTRGHLQGNALAQNGIDVKVKPTQQDLDAVRALLRNEYVSKNVAHVGDTVRIDAGRKYPIGTEFVVTSTDSFVRYGRVDTEYLIGNGIKTNKNNCTVIKCGYEYFDGEMVRG